MLFDIYPSFRVTGWPEHWTNGGTGVTKLSDGYLGKVSMSVRLFNDPMIYIQNEELHSSRRVSGLSADLSDFWEFHRDQQRGVPQLNMLPLL